MEISTQTKYPDSQYQHHAATAPSAIPVVSTVIQIPDPTTVLTLHDHALRRVRDSLRSTSGIFGEPILPPSSPPLPLIAVAALPDTACRITDLQRWLQTFHRLHSRMQYFLCRMGLFLSWYGDVESRKVFSILVVTVRTPITAPRPWLYDETARDRSSSRFFPDAVCIGAHRQSDLSSKASSFGTHQRAAQSSLSNSWKRLRNNRTRADTSMTLTSGSPPWAIGLPSSRCSTHLLSRTWILSGVWFHSDLSHFSPVFSRQPGAKW